MHKHSNILMNTGGSLSQTESMAGDIAMKSLEGGMLYKCIVLIYRVCIKINRFQPYLGLFHLGTGPWTCESKHMCCRHSLSVFLSPLVPRSSFLFTHKLHIAIRLGCTGGIASWPRFKISKNYKGHQRISNHIRDLKKLSGTSFVLKSMVQDEPLLCQALSSGTSKVECSCQKTDSS